MLKWLVTENGSARRDAAAAANRPYIAELNWPALPRPLLPDHDKGRRTASHIVTWCHVSCGRRGQRSIGRRRDTPDDVTLAMANAGHLLPGHLPPETGKSTSWTLHPRKPDPNSSLTLNPHLTLTLITPTVILNSNPITLNPNPNKGFRYPGETGQMSGEQMTGHGWRRRRLLTARFHYRWPGHRARLCRARPHPTAAHNTPGPSCLWRRCSPTDCGVFGVNNHKSAPRAVWPYCSRPPHVHHFLSIKQRR